MADIVIYTTSTCPYCHRAKRLLDKKGSPYQEIDVGTEPQLRAEMTQRAGGKHTVPQIFINDQHVGGCDDLHELDADGALDTLLGKGSA